MTRDELIEWAKDLGDMSPDGISEAIIALDSDLSLARKELAAERLAHKEKWVLAMELAEARAKIAELEKQQQGLLTPCDVIRLRDADYGELLLQKERISALESEVLALRAELAKAQKKLFDHEQERAPLLGRVCEAQERYAHEIVKRQDAESDCARLRDRIKELEARP